VTRVFGINDRGDLVGNFVDTAGRTHGFLAQVSQ
jgi:probable HAF family extracellular repeat protein